MSRTWLSVGSATLILAAFGCTNSREKPPDMLTGMAQQLAFEPSTHVDAWNSQFESIPSELSLSWEELAAFNTALQIARDGLSQWVAAKGPQLAKLDRQIVEAVKKRDLTAQTNAIAVAKP